MSDSYITDRTVIAVLIFLGHLASHLSVGEWLVMTPLVFVELFYQLTCISDWGLL